ncbi:MAG: nuclear transport factor 2 family protein [Pseudomonadaceae bacterium]|nr:nuclear transport factor 2 family protein [Pseudomonadaceae bacterium]
MIRMGIAALFLTIVSACSADVVHSEAGEVVQSYLRAFNAQDAQAMAAMVADDVKWLSINKESVSVELEGKDALVPAMQSYFDSCPTCRSAIGRLVWTDNLVSVIETASWEVNGETRTQRSLAVYEFDGKLIQAVYYFPEES